MRTAIGNRFNIVWVIVCCVLVFFGCAGYGTRLGDEGPESGISGEKRPAGSTRAVETAGSSTTITPTLKAAERQEEPPVMIDDSGEFELIKTPFGYLKRRIKTAQAAPPSASPQTAPSGPADGIPQKEKHPPQTAAPAQAAEKDAEESGEEKGGVTFNFDNADIYEVIRTISEILQINYIVDPDVRGTVTIHTTRGLNREDIFPVFRQILEASGLMIVEEGAIHKIVSAKDAARMPIALRSESDMSELPPSEQTIIQIVPLEFISAQEMTKLLTPFVSSSGTMIVDAPSNTLLVVDKGINILKVRQLVDVFDINLLDKVSHRFYFLTNIDAEEATKTLKDIFASYPSIGKDKLGLIPIERLNAILAITPQRDILERLNAFVAQLDIPSEDMGPRIYVYSVRNGEAGQLSELLNSIFGKGGAAGKKSEKEFVHPNPLAIGAGKKEQQETAKPEEASPAQEAAVSGASGSIRGEIKITPDEVRNALVIEAAPRDYKIIQGILERLDVLPRQVLIEATVAEITLGKGYEMGVEWTFRNEPWTETGSLSATIGAAGLNYAIGLTDKWQAALTALEQDNNVNILSSPHVLASDNKEARIDISTEIPVASTSYNYTGSNSDVLETNIQYRDTGVMLSVTPHINERGLVTMDINQEVSEQSSSVSVAGKDYPSFYKRSVNTNLTVKHGQTLVIGGLISEVESDAMAGVPCLIGIPLMRYLFGRDKQSRTKTELIVMITPRVIIDLEDVDEVTEEFKKKVSQVTEKMDNKNNDQGKRFLF
jgi:general secretion pathway protein D